MIETKPFGFAVFGNFEKVNGNNVIIRKSKTYG